MNISRAKPWSRTFLLLVSVIPMCKPHPKRCCSQGFQVLMENSQKRSMLLGGHKLSLFFFNLVLRQTVKETFAFAQGTKENCFWHVLKNCRTIFKNCRTIFVHFVEQTKIYKIFFCRCESGFWETSKTKLKFHRGVFFGKECSGWESEQYYVWSIMYPHKGRTCKASVVASGPAEGISGEGNCYHKQRRLLW